MTNSKKETSHLIQELEKGNEKAYLSLIEEYYQKMFVYALSLAKEQALAEDLVQNIFMKLWEQRTRLVIKDSLQSFLYKSVYNDFVNHYKKKQTSVKLDQLYLQTLNQFTEDERSTETEDRLLWMKKAIDTLPNKCKQVFLLSKQEGLTNAEIAAYLKISIKSVEAHITNAYSILREKTADAIQSLS
ncbi:RNA polymerase sigma factor [Ochrovirga pacifica]|uniref:RNA polymerase sigma factor n=1 Tax=Ochrovirga pacifica TaxID=1042376 RepID=UPI0002559D72|nr:RNA polymerase sigma-70 factor [Ochrovirga pacifica]